MLYLSPAMDSVKSENPLLPEPMQMSVWDSLKLNAWAGVAVAAAFGARLCLHDPEVSGGLRVAVALLPVLPGVLYVRALWRWMSELDELQRRIQLEAVCGATLAMLLVALVTDLLRGAGLGASLTLGWEGYFALTFLFYSLGLLRANRRWR